MTRCATGVQTDVNWPSHWSCLQQRGHGDAWPKTCVCIRLSYCPRHAATKPVQALRTHPAQSLFTKPHTAHGKHGHTHRQNCTGTRTTSKDHNICARMLSFCLTRRAVKAGNSALIPKEVAIERNSGEREQQFQRRGLQTTARYRVT